MKKILFFCAFCILLGNVAFAEPENMETLRQQLIIYHDSGQYQKDFKNVIANAKLFLLQKVSENNLRQHPHKLAIVFDIDETTLSNYDDMKHLRFGGTLDEIEAGVADGHATVLKHSLELYRLARQHNVDVFFVTGRKPFERANTERNLKAAGYTHWSGLVFKPADYHQHSAIPYKSLARSLIEKNGYEIVETIGDQYSDIQGGHADKGFKLPNPYYYIP